MLTRPHMCDTTGMNGSFCAFWAGKPIVNIALWVLNEVKELFNPFPVCGEYSNLLFHEKGILQTFCPSHRLFVQGLSQE